MSQKRCSKRLAAKRVSYDERSGSESEGLDQDSSRSVVYEPDSDEESLDFSVLDFEPTTTTTTTTTTTITSTTNRPHFTPVLPTTSKHSKKKRHYYSNKNKKRHEHLKAQWLAKTGKPVPDNFYVQIRNGKLFLVMKNFSKCLKDRAEVMTARGSKMIALGTKLIEEAKKLRPDLKDTNEFKAFLEEFDLDSYDPNDIDIDIFDIDIFDK